MDLQRHLVSMESSLRLYFWILGFRAFPHLQTSIPLKITGEVEAVLGESLIWRRVMGVLAWCRTGTLRSSTNSLQISSSVWVTSVTTGRTCAPRWLRSTT